MLLSFSGKKNCQEKKRKKTPNMVIWDGQVQGSFDNERALTNGRKDKLLTGEQIQSDKPVGSDCALWSLPVTCCSTSASLCTAQGTWFQMFSWALAELTFHVAEGQSIIFFALPHDLCARWSYQTPQWFASEPNVAPGPQEKEKRSGCGTMTLVIDTMLWSKPERKSHLLVTDKWRGEV